MKKVFLFILSCFCVLAGIYSSVFLPGTPSQLIEKKYNNWSGVIRVWVAEGTKTLSILNACATSAEDLLNGIYFNVQEVPASAIANYPITGIKQPDIIIYPSTITPDTSQLEVIPHAYPLRKGITANAYSTPVFLNANFWIYDTSALINLPGNMYSVRTACSADDMNALVALSTGMRPEEGVIPPLPGLDLGLSGTNTNTPQQTGETACRIGPNLTITEQPRKAFFADEADAFIGSTADILKLSDKPNIAAAVTGEYIYSDNAIMCSIIRKNDSRSKACFAFLDLLMTEGQLLAARAQLFPAISGVSAWSGNITLNSIEAALEERTWILGNTGSSEAAQQYIEEKISADEAMEHIISMHHQ